MKSIKYEVSFGKYLDLDIAIQIVNLIHSELGIHAEIKAINIGEDENDSR